MRTHKKLFSLLLVLCLMFSMTSNAFARSYSGDDVYPGLSGIQPEDSLTLPKNTIWATLTACWGVKVIFVDWDETELKSETVPVTDTTPGSSSAPEDPTRSGYIFTGWERHDNNGDTNVILHDDGSVTNVTGPGPIIYIATYIRRVGDLTVSKTIAGNGAASGKAFDFTVTLGDTSVNGTYGGMSFTNGVAAFSLKGGESVTATGLPAGTAYTVTEADYSAEGYETAKSGDTGTIADGKTAEAAFTNTRMAYGNLTVSKTVTGNGADSSKAFAFTVTLGDTSVNGTYGGMSFTNGVAAFSLKGGESVTATGLPAGTGYTVTEADYSAEGYETAKSGDTGTIADGETAEAAFTNTRMVYGNLTISKLVTGNLGDKTKYFTFTVMFDTAGTFSYTGSHSGTITGGGSIPLKHGESITITGIPAGAHYSVTESGNSGYSVYASGNTGVIAVGQTSAAKFTNSRSTVPKTGEDNNLMLGLSLMVISVLGMAGTMLSGNKKRRKPAHLKNR